MGDAFCEFMNVHIWLDVREDMMVHSFPKIIVKMSGCKGLFIGEWKHVQMKYSYGDNMNR